jgi:NADH:ubiquinone oxidoreductase subunit 6 (subunit J)
VSLEELAFLALAVIAVATGLAALLVRELVHTILWVSVFFVDLSAIYFLLEAPFLGVLQLGVYAGAVTVLLLFGIMVTRKRIFSRDAATGLGPVPRSVSSRARPAPSRRTRRRCSRRSCSARTAPGSFSWV